jgi:hypothetical protein
MVIFSRLSGWGCTVAVLSEGRSPFPLSHIERTCECKGVPPLRIWLQPCNPWIFRPSLIPPRPLPSAEKLGMLRAEPRFRRIKMRVLCACDFLSYIGSHRRGCVLTQGILLAFACRWCCKCHCHYRVYRPSVHHFCRSYRWSRCHVPLGTNGDNGTNGDFCVSYNFRPSVSTSILAWQRR